MKLSLGALLAGAAAATAAGSSSSSSDGGPLLLTKYVESGDLEGARTASLISGLKVGTTAQDANMGHAGFVSVPSESGDRVNNLYTWIQPCSDCDETSPDTPMIVWLQGGPGAPGNFGSFAEIGNYYVDGDLNLQERCFTWCATANCLFIDQPTMTGFSFQSYPNGTAISDPKAVEYTTTSPKAMEQVYQVLVQMFTIFPEHQKQPLYITGESYGGIYTGNLGWVIYNHNQQLQAQHLSEKFSKTAALRGPNPVPTTMPINFVGLAVGDPVMNGQYQWGACVY